jgi:hypothetical protein
MLPQPPRMSRQMRPRHSGIWYAEAKDSMTSKHQRANPSLRVSSTPSSKRPKRSATSTRPRSKSRAFPSLSKAAISLDSLRLVQEKRLHSPCPSYNLSSPSPRVSTPLSSLRPENWQRRSRLRSSECNHTDNTWTFLTLFRALGSIAAVRVALVVGGLDMTAQAIALAKKPHVVVATPASSAPPQYHHRR